MFYISVSQVVLPMSRRITRTLPPTHPRLKHLDRLGVLLDSSIRLPLTNFRIGLDSILGLVPGLGDIIGLGLAAYIVFEGARLGVPRATLLRMASNVGVDALVGTVPVLGDVFDATYKANLRNVNLVREHLGADASGQAKADKRFLVGVGLMLVLALAGIVALIVVIGIGLARLLNAAAAGA